MADFGGEFGVGMGVMGVEAWEWAVFCVGPSDDVCLELHVAGGNVAVLIGTFEATLDAVDAETRVEVEGGIWVVLERHGPIFVGGVDAV